MKGDQTITYFAVPHSDEFVYVGKEAFADSIVEHVDLFDSVTSIGAEASAIVRSLRRSQSLLL